MTTRESSLVDFSGGVTERDNLTLSDSFKLGQALGFLREAGRNNYEIGEEDEGGVLGILEEVRITLRTRDIESPVEGKISQFKNDIQDEYEESDESLSSEHGDELEQRATTWLNLLQQNLQNERRIPVAETGVMEVEGLLENPESLFSRPVWNWLHKRPKSDIKEACRSIVIDSPTASVMLSLRAAEHCLREWHEDKTGDSLEAAWGRVLGRLIEEYLDDDSDDKSFQQQLAELPPVLSNLYYLKEKRNEVNHPEESPTNSEARRTLMFSVGTISEIYDEMVEEIHVVYEGIEMSIPRNSTSDSEVVLNIIRKLDDGDGAHNADVYEFAEEFGLSQQDVKEAKRDILMDGQAYEPASDTIKPI